MKKLLILILTIALPLGIYFFLKHFGVNRFSVPIQFEHGIAGCDSLDIPHVVPPISFSTINGNPSATDKYGEFKVFSFLFTTDHAINDKILYQVGRVQDAFIDDAQVVVFTLTTTDVFSRVGLKGFEDYRTAPEKWIVGTTAGDELEAFLGCGVGISKKFPENDDQKNTTLVLVDNNGLIRGYYDGTDRDDTDRLIVELQILLRENSLDNRS